MSKKWITAVAAVVMLGLGAASPADAEDFNFTIPVKVLSLASPDIGGHVRCGVGIGPVPGVGGWGGLSSAVGEGGTNFDVDSASGNYTSTVSVKFNASVGRNPATATHWACWLVIRQPNGGVRADVIAPSRAKSGAPFIGQVQGALP